MSAAALAFGGLLAVACGTDNGTTPVNGVEGGRTDTDKDDSGTDPGDDTDSGTTDGGAPDCKYAPTLHKPGPGFYCAFFTRDGGADAGDGGVTLGAQYCGDDETCCNPTKGTGSDYPDSFCAKGKPTTADDSFCAGEAANYGSTWPAPDKYAGSSWACAVADDCAGGEVCCLFTDQVAAANGDKVNIGKSLDKDIPAACGALQVFKQGGTICRPTTCQAGEIEMCSSDADCSGSKKCTPFDGYHRDLAYCR